MSVAPLDNAVVWGQVFEIAVKRGVLAFLLNQKLIAPDHPQLVPWTAIRTAKLYAAVREELGLLDDNLIEQAKHALAHVLLLGYGLGWTCLREWLRGLKGRRYLGVNALWCPLSLPKLERDRESDVQEAELAFQAAFRLNGSAGALVGKGAPAWSDFTLWLTSPRKSGDHLLVLEFSHNAPLTIPDFTRETDHLEELTRFARMMDARSVFSRVCAEVRGEQFELSPALASHLGAFTSRDKPFFKLCQGASYVDQTIALLRDHGKLSGPVTGRVIAVTSNGFESLAATFSDETQDPRRRLMTDFGEAYRRTIKVSDGEAEARLQDEMRMVFNQLSRALPKEFRRQVESLGRMPEPGEEIRFDFREQITGFYRPTDVFHLAQAVDLVNEAPELSAYFGQPARSALANELPRFGTDGRVSLRDLHGAAVVAALRAKRRGRLNVLALEGNPGIGKTTGVRRYLTEFADEGYLFLYVSPRVVINKDVTDKFAHHDDGSVSGIVTMTTNATLIRNAPVGYKAMVLGAGGPDRRIDRAVVVEGAEGLKLPEQFDTWFITPEEEAHLERLYGGENFKITQLTERDSLLQERKRPGVLQTLGLGAQRLLAANTHVNRVVLTASIQGYRETNGGTTINGLSKLFDDPNPKSRAGKAERARFARRFPNVLVMLDEVAGDGAGALFVDEIARWLDHQFIEPFENDEETSPFTATLIIADASLGNETVLESYLAAKPIAPEKVLVSKSGGNYPFKLAATQFTLGSAKADVLHIMTNSFPATELGVQYRVKLHRLTPELRDDGVSKTVRERVRNQGDTLLLASAREEILSAVDDGALQVIFFAQSKAFLSQLRHLLCHGSVQKTESIMRRGDVRPFDVTLTVDEVAILDSSITASERKRLVSPAVRDCQRVFLMTSSGARGVSFPRASRIIAAIPRFNLESSLMEVAQLIYRGRGSYQEPDTGVIMSGDDVPRELVMLIDDFLPEEALENDPRIWLRRSSDLLTLVLMLRGTIHTRIKGDAGLPGKDLAIVPVGLIGGTEMITSLSQALETFLREGQIYALRATSDLRAPVQAALQHIVDLFSTYTLTGEEIPTGYRTFTAPRELENLAYAITRAGAALAVMPAEENSDIPENSYCLGPFWLEDWSDIKKRESFVFDKFSEAIDKSDQVLKGQLSYIRQHPDLPPKLKDAARDLYRILARNKDEVKREFATLKALNSRATWLTLPLDYPRFWRKASLKDGRPIVIREGGQWRDGLARAFQAATNIVPVLPHYEEYPFAASIGTPDPMRLYQVFDDRYFMASTELNLLNTLLLSSNT